MPKICNSGDCWPMSPNESKSFTSCRFLATLRPWSWQHPRARTSWSESRSKVATQLANATSRSREQKFIERQSMSSIQYQALKVWWRGCGEEEDLDRFSLATSAASQCNRNIYSNVKGKSYQGACRVLPWGWEWSPNLVASWNLGWAATHSCPKMSQNVHYTVTLNWITLTHPYHIHMQYKVELICNWICLL